MTSAWHVLAIDQGTTSTRAIVFDAAGRPVALAQRELPQIFPGDGLVEHDSEAIWQATLATAREAGAAVGFERIAAIGIANQRETTLLWDRRDGRPLHNAIVWQDRRGAALCRDLVDGGHDRLIRERTGLEVDSYFSATKLRWLLDHARGDLAEQVRAGELAFGTVDSFLLWRLTGGRHHVTDATNAARTMLFDIHRQVWDPDLLALFDIPASLLPEVRDNAADFGLTDPRWFGRTIPVTGMAGDQHAAMVGQACFAPGMVKSTFGTGAFVLAHTGDRPVASSHRLLTTLAYRLEGRPSYALEGAVFNSGTSVKWLRDMLKVIGGAAETEALARGMADNRGVYFVPAFTGLGAPWWDPDARGALSGLTRDTGIAELARAALEAVGYQTLDLIRAMQADGLTGLGCLRVDGGMAVNDWLMQFLADILDSPVERPLQTETTALGAACLAGLGAGLWQGLDEIAALWQRQARFEPAMRATERTGLVAGWHKAVERVLSARGD
jgi:glycerol kinase